MFYSIWLKEDDLAPGDEVFDRSHIGKYGAMTVSRIN